MTLIPTLNLTSCNIYCKLQKLFVLTDIPTGLCLQGLFTIWAKCCVCLVNHNGLLWEILFLSDVNFQTKLCTLNFLRIIRIVTMNNTIQSMVYMSMDVD